MDLMNAGFWGTETGCWFMREAWPERRHRIKAEKVKQWDSWEVQWMLRVTVGYEVGRLMQVHEDKEASASTEERKRQRNDGIITARGKKNFSLCVSSQFKVCRRLKLVKHEKNILEEEKEQNCELGKLVTGWSEECSRGPQAALGRQLWAQAQLLEGVYRKGMPEIWKEYKYLHNIASKCMLSGIVWIPQSSGRAIYGSSHCCNKAVAIVYFSGSTWCAVCFYQRKGWTSTIRVLKKIYSGNEEALILSKITLVLTKKKQKPHRLR